MKISERLRNYAKHVENKISVICYASMDKELKIYVKILIAITIGYALSPIDLIPDFIPVLGYLDDMLIIPGMVFLIYKLIPKQILNRSKEKALLNPINLKKEWKYIFIPIFAWAIILLIIYKTIHVA